MAEENHGIIDDLSKEQKSILSSIKRISKVRIEEEEYVCRMIQKISKDRNIEDENVRIAIEKETIEKISAMREHQISRLSETAQIEARKSRINDLEEERKNLAEKHSIRLAYIEANIEDEEEREEAKKAAIKEAQEAELSSIRKIQQEHAKMVEAQKVKRAKEKEYAKSVSVKEVGKKVMSNIKETKSLKGAEAMLAPLSKLPGQFKSALGNLSKDLKEQSAQSRKEADLLQEEYKALLEGGAEADSEEMQELFQKVQEAELKATKDANKANAAAMADAVQKSLESGYKKSYEQAVSILTDYKGKIDARMQGTDKDFKDLQNTISNNLALSPFVKSTKVLDKLAAAVEQGISYNVEQRSFLSSVADKIASTFDAFDSNLVRLIRLQQADSTAARMGMEASLTKLFNGMFQDTSYLSGAYDSVSGAILDANSQLSRDASAEFEFTVQKWLGALSSLGMSNETITTIAQGINYLATGNVTSLSSNSSLQTMLAMAASNANLEYSEMLLEGMDADKTNRLLESMILYLKEIAENSDSQVVKAAYGDVFNMSLSDMSAISNITLEEISKLSSHTMTYDNMMSEMNSQLNQLITRTSIAEMLDNVYDNVLFSVASDMASNPVTFMMQKMLDFMRQTETDINIPFINAMGFGLDLNASVKDLMQMGLGIGQAFSLAGTLATALSGGGFGNRLGDTWKATETTQRGAGLNLSSASTLGGVSGSLGTFAQSGNSQDATNSSISSATDDSEDSKKITNKNLEPPEHSIEDLYKAIVGDSAEAYVKVKDSNLMEAYDSPTQSFRVFDPRLTVESGMTKDATLVAAYDQTTRSLRIVDGRMPTEGGKMQVYDSAIEKEVIAINKLLADRSTSSQTVSIASGSTVNINQTEMTTAMRTALFGNASESISALADVLKILKDGLLTVAVSKVGESVEVKNSPGDKLQVSNLVW